ncbi:hypoxanthine phosphoribosyltransferase [Coprothermobacter platensis]|uniref:hypoxanthine phosphoribosyltransferase n=1 Tax=Coprothermobacter platensis TaxID=108819 RepID=UPI0003658012|nr:hypoxanthine phosphoribosyltransferase [Coprothermobacter platensis]
MEELGISESVEKVLISQDDLQRRIRELGQEISYDYAGKTPLFVGILKGAFIFLSDLIRNISIPCHLDFMQVSSYGGGTDSSGIVKILKDLDISVEGRNVIIVEDIVDTGITMKHLLELLSARKPASLSVCTLLDKKERREVDVDLDYVGFEIPNAFVVGYGLDYAEYYRNLPFIGVLRPSVYETR